MTIDPTQPFHSLVQFTKGHAFLGEKAKLDFFQALQTLFSDYAYRDVTLHIPESLYTRFQEIDLPNLYSTLNTELIPHKRFIFAQLIANISKVARCGLPFIHHEGIYPIWIVEDEKAENPRYWGWIYRSFAENAPLLMEKVNPQGILRIHGLSPLVLWTLQRFQEASGSLTLKRNIDIPDTCAKAFIQFLDDYDMKGIKSAFSKWMQTSAKSTPVKNQSMFDPKRPLRSLKRFAGRCVTLEKDHRYDFMNAFSRFFEDAAYADQTIPFPKGYSKRFTTIDLPFLLTLAPPPTKEDKIRLLAAIQHVSKLQISSVIMFNYRLGNDPLERQMGFTIHPELCFLIEKPFPCEEIELLADEIKNETPLAISHFFCRHFDQPSVQAQLKEKKIFLKPSAGRFEEKQLLKILIHNLAVEPKTAMKSLIQRTLGEIPLSRKSLKELWNRVEAVRQQELLDIYIEEIHRTLKPRLDLDHLKLFASHLALGQVCFLHAEAEAFYHFLKDPQVAHSFIHPEVLQKMIETFPHVYPAVIAEEKLEQWRSLFDQPLNTFFKAFEQIPIPIVQSIKEHLKQCCFSLQSQESMETGFVRIFAEEHSFQEETDSMKTLDTLFKEANNLFGPDCPEPLRNAYLYVQKLLSQYLDLCSHLQEYQSMLEPFPIDEDNPVNRLMNLVWKTTFNMGWKQPIPTHLQVEWLYILSQLQLNIDLELAAKLLSSHRACPEPLENPQITLTLLQLKQLMSAKSLLIQSLSLLSQFRVFEKMDDASILSKHALDDQAQKDFTQFLHQPEVLQLIAPHPELEQFRQRLINLYEPNLLSQSLLTLSQMFAWKKS